MKIILVIILLSFSYLVVAQTNEPPPKNSKPSWSSRMPDRNDAPEFDTDEEDRELSGLKMDRSALFDDEDTSSSLVTDDNSEVTTVEEQEGAAEQERLAKSDRIAEQERQAEADRVAEQERQAETDRIAVQERQTEAVSLAEQEGQTEADRIAKQEKIAQDQKRAAEKRDLEQKNIADNKLNTTEGIQDTKPKPYNWKKIKNTLPVYPTKAARDGKEGWVDVEFIINNSGTVIGAHPVKTFKNSKLFNKAALRAVRQWKYDPPSKYGVKFNQTKTVRIVFNLAN